MDMCVIPVDTRNGHGLYKSLYRSQKILASKQIKPAYIQR